MQSYWSSITCDNICSSRTVVCYQPISHLIVLRWQTTFETVKYLDIWHRKVSKEKKEDLSFSKQDV